MTIQYIKTDTNKHKDAIRAIVTKVSSPVLASETPDMSFFHGSAKQKNVKIPPKTVIKCEYRFILHLLDDQSRPFRHRRGRNYPLFWENTIHLRLPEKIRLQLEMPQTGHLQETS